MSKMVKIVCPPAGELSYIKTHIPCSEAGCRKTFLNSANLDFHLIKYHKQESNTLKKKGDSETIIHYHCPEDKCLYRIGSKRFFVRMKYLKQHYLKVHAEKSFTCDNCAKGFPTQSALKRHTPICGVKYTCSCGHTYESYEALLTHSKRSQHFIDKKYKTAGRVSVSTSPSTGTEFVQVSNLNHQSVSTVAVPVFLAAIALSELSNACNTKSVDIAVQTEPGEFGKQSRRQSSSKFGERGTKRGTSQQTQTGCVARNRRPKISTQTQTSGDYILKKAMQAAEIPIAYEKQVAAKKRRKSMETQTIVADKRANKKMCTAVKYPSISVSEKPTSFASLAHFPNASPYQLEIDASLPDLWTGQKNSSATQTSPVKNGIDQEMLSSVTQTDINLSAFFENESCEPNTSYMHSSSQTVKLPTYFEESSSCSFGPVGTQPNYELANVSCSDFGSFDEPGYSCAQMESILTRNKKFVFDEHRSCSTETQTELDSLLTECNEDDDTSFTLCSNIETQTTEDISTFDQLIYSNMCTQTCDEFLFSDLGFVDIQTQTAWSEYDDDSIFVSTETQTALSGSSSESNWPNTLGTSHMETQTDEFRELFAELEKQNTSEKVL